VIEAPVAQPLQDDLDEPTALAVRGSPKMKLSDSLKSAARDEFVYVSKRGEVRPSWRYQAGRVGTLVATVGVGGLGIALCFMAGTPFLSVIYIATLVFVANLWRHGERLKRGATLVASDRLDEAQAELEPLVSARFVPKTVRALAWQNLGGVEARRSNHATALEYTRKCKALLEGTRWVPAGPWRWISRFNEALLLAQLGRIEEAKAAVEGLKQAPEGEYFQILRMNVELMLAFERHDASSLPDDLFPWAKLALETTSAELALALLAWAHFERGDEDMGGHLLEAARDRIDSGLFARVYPDVHVWLRSR
jgi:tetratricopeptide (TPR) repeat protein